MAVKNSDACVQCESAFKSPVEVFSVDGDVPVKISITGGG